MRSFWVIFFSAGVLFVTSCAILSFAVGSGDGTAPPAPQESAETSDAATTAATETSDVQDTTRAFHAWIAHPEDIFEANLLHVRIRLFPDANAFPGLGMADVNRLDDMVVQATVQVEGIGVPLWKPQIAHRPQSHIQREKARGREALEFCRRAVLNAAGLLVVAPRYDDADRVVHCRIMLIDETGDRTDLGALLVKNGFAARQDVDWGRRRPE